MLSKIEALMFSYVPLNSIRVDPMLTPKALAISKHVEPDRETRENYIAIAQEYDYKEPLKVGQIKGSSDLTLLSNYECYQAYQELYFSAPETAVPVTTLKFSGALTQKAVATQLASFERAQQPYLSRLFDLYHYQKLGLDIATVRRIYNIRRSSSAQGKMLRRDLTIAGHPRLLDHILGTKLAELGAEDSFIKPDLGQASIPYSYGLTLIRVLGSDPGAIDEFLDRFGTYILQLRSAKISQEEETKPIYQWSTYNRTVITSIAMAVATSQAIPCSSSVDDDDYQWDLNLNERSGEYRIPQTAYNIHDRGPENIRRMVEIAYKASKLAQSLEAHISRIRPVSHGGPLKVGESSVEPRIPIPSNTPKFEDADYVRAIRKNKSLRYANRAHLLRCLHLWPGIFGFESSAPHANSIYEQAAKGFEEWYQSQFLADVFRFHKNNAEGHPLYKYYIAIRTFLARYKDDPSDIQFKDFVIELFSYVFSTLDRDEDVMRSRAEDLLRLEGRMRRISWDEISAALNDGKKVPLSRDEIEALLRERVEKREDRIVRAIGAQNQILNRVISDPMILREGTKDREAGNEN